MMKTTHIFIAAIIFAFTPLALAGETFYDFTGDYQGWILQYVERYYEQGGTTDVLDYSPFSWGYDEQTHYPYLPGADASGSQGAYEVALALTGIWDDNDAARRWFDAVYVQSEDFYTHNDQTPPPGYPDHSDYPGSWMYGHYGSLPSVSGNTTLSMRVYCPVFTHQNHKVLATAYSRSGTGQTWGAGSDVELEHGWNIVDLPVSAIADPTDLLEVGVKFGGHRIVTTDMYVDVVQIDETTLNDGRYVYFLPDSSWFSDGSGYDQKTVSVWYDDGGAAIPRVRGFHIELTYPSSYVSVASIDEGDFLSGTGGTIGFFYDDDGAGRVTIDAAILGTTGGASGWGTLFTVTFDGSGASEGCGDLDFDLAHCIIRDVDNQDLTATYVDGWTSHDTSGPQQPNLSSPTHPEGAWTSASDVVVQWNDVSDLPAICGVGVEGYYLKADQNPTTLPSPSDYDAYMPAGMMPEPYEWTFTLGDGADYYVHISAYDWVGNPGTVDHYGPFSIDTEPPGDVTSMQAVAGHNQVDLSWTPPGDASAVKIYRKAWTYPEYDDDMPQPDPPAFIGDGELVGEFPVTTTQTTDTFTELERNYYVYTAWAVDGAGNHSAEPAPGSAQDWALSYWLGDFDDDYNFDCDPGGYDGYVDGADLNALSAVFSLTDGEPGYCNEMDIGPTSDGLETGYPLTDDLIGFEDLMIFSMIYGNATPLLLPLTLGIAGESELLFCLSIDQEALQTGAEMRAVLSVRGNVEGFKGLRAIIGFDSDGLTFLHARPGEELAGSGTAFFAVLPGRESVEIDLAVLGRGREMVGDGDLVRLAFAVSDPEGIDLRVTDIDVRDSMNQQLLATSEDPIVPPNGGLPSTVQFRGAEPNPVRGSAVLAFALPQASHVVLRLVDISGRQAREFYNTTLAAGYYRELWDGRDGCGNPLATGVYLARFQTERASISRQVLVIR